MSFSLVTDVFNKIDTVTSVFVDDIMARTIAEFTPVVTAGLTVSFLAYGIMVILGKIEMPIVEFIGKSIRIGVISSIALAGGIYQSDIADVLVGLPDDISTLLIEDATTGTGATNAFDAAASKGFDAAGQAFEASSFSAEGIALALVGIIIAIAAAVLTSIGAGFLILAKVAVALLVGLGPIFILALLFKPLERFFEMWMGQIMNYTFMIVLFSAVFSFLMDIFGSYVGDIQFGVQSIANILGGAIILSGAFVLLLLQLPSLASGLASGIGISYLSEMRSIRNGVGSRSIKDSDGNLRARGSGLIGAGGSAARGASALKQKLFKPRQS